MIHFDPRAHIYYNEDNEIYDSPSKVFSYYKNKFDAEAASIAYAAKNGRTPEYWREQWAKTRDESLERGTGIHETKEELMQGRGIEKHNGKLHQVHNSERFIIRNLYQLPDGVWPEIPIWNDKYKISGKPDKPVIETIKSNGIPKRYVHIDDFKTNKSIDKVSFFNYKTQEHKMMLGPLSHLMDCNWVHYALQMSFYQFIFEEAGFYVGTRTLVHIPHPVEVTDMLSGRVIDKMQPADVLYKIPYMRREILLTLADYNQRRSYQRYKQK